MKRRHIPLWNPAKHRMPRKLLSCLLAAGLGLFMLAAPPADVRADGETTEPVNLIAGQIPVQVYMAQRSNYSEIAPGTFRLDNNPYAAGQDNANEEPFRAALEKLTDGIVDGTDSNCLNLYIYGNGGTTFRYPGLDTPVVVLIYDLGRETEVREIRLTSTNDLTRVVAGYDCYIGQSIEDLADFFSEENRVYTSGGNEVKEGAFDPAYSLTERVTAVDLSEGAARGRYAAVVVTRPYATGALGYNIARMAEIAVYGSFPSFDPAPQVTARTADSLSLSWTADASAVTYQAYASTEPFDGEIPEEMEPALTIGADSGASGTISGILTGLEAETAYYIAITAEDDAGNVSTWFSENTVSTTAVNTSTGQLIITADVGVSYTLSIPTSMGTITAAGDHAVGTLYASKLILGEGDKLTVSAEHKDVLTHTNGTETLAYTLNSADHGGEAMAPYQSVEFTEDSPRGEAGGTDLYVSISQDDWNAAAAGRYTDTVTFQVDYTSGE